MLQLWCYCELIWSALDVGVKLSKPTDTKKAGKFNSEQAVLTGDQIYANLALRQYYATLSAIHQFKTAGGSFL